MGQLKENSSTEGPSKVTPRVRSQPDKHNRSSMEGLKPVSLVVSLPSRRELSVVKQSRGDAESDGGIPSISVSGYTYVSECGARQSFNMQHSSKNLELLVTWGLEFHSWSCEWLYIYHTGFQCSEVRTHSAFISHNRTSNTIYYTLFNWLYSIYYTRSIMKFDMIWFQIFALKIAMATFRRHWLNETQTHSLTHTVR